MIATTLLLASSTQTNESGQPISQSAIFAVWDTAGSTAYVWSAGAIPVGQDVSAWLTANAASYLASAQATPSAEMPTDVQGRAILFAQKAPGLFAAGAIAATLSASSLFGGFGQQKKNAITAALTAAATTENSFMSAPGLVLS